MAFFDDLGKKLSQAGQNVAQKTKDFSEISKLNNAISSEEKRINSMYLQLGKEYYVKHTSDSEACFEQLVLAIKDAEIKIEMLRQQIQDIKKVARCEKCGAEIPNDVAFCSNCGNPAPMKAPVTVSENVVVCASCGQTIAAGVKFCTFCGTPMEAEVPVVPVAPVEESIQYAPAEENIQYAPAEENVIYAPAEENVTYAPESDPALAACPHCNAELQPDSMFCTNCGNKVN